ncbi:hypothetical protein ACLVWU_16485 [Bdellovibrio sp. HCB290]|uniref:hypothetical protein n=1 Tax=Bdellovibrio sp. HCB290 TaxID=3394356 RepID=UPI0039B46CEB
MIVGNLIRKIIYFTAVLSTGLFAGFTGFFAISFGPSLREIPPAISMEFFRFDKTAFDRNVLVIYIVMAVSIGSWLLLWRNRYRMVDFYFILGSFLCVLQEIFLSYLGHYRINTIFRSFSMTHTIGSDVYALREEWAYFMNFHFATNTLGFILILAALKRATSGRETPNKNFLAATPK